ncbi:MAG: hypothetical protein WBB01_12385 [Phormidesmis sp.]
MLSTTVPNIKKSKHACPSCQEHLLTTNDNFKTDDLMHHHCVNCGYDFFDTERERKHREREERHPKDDQPWNMGFILLLAMVTTIIIIALSDREAQRDTEPVNRVGWSYVGSQLPV